MGRLIDVDKFKANYGMKDDCADCDKELRGKSKACEFDRVYTKMDFCGWLDDAPTVDAVPVVRCKGCKYWDAFPSSTLAPDHHECKRIRIHTTAEWYCAEGERKDGDG